ncbi:MAG: hypothetical protein WCA46_26530 [Actinocatenispora sp.]
MSDELTAKFRYNAALAIAAFVALCGAVPLAASRWYLSVVLLVPLAVVLWGWRAGVDVRAGAMVVRWAVGGRRIDADEVTGFTITRRSVHAVLTDDRTVWLPAVPGTRVPVLTEALGLQVTAGPADGADTADAAQADAAQADPTGTGPVDPGDATDGSTGTAENSTAENSTAENSTAENGTNADDTDADRGHSADDETVPTTPGTQRTGA